MRFPEPLWTTSLRAVWIKLKGIHSCTLWFYLLCFANSANMTLPCRAVLLSGLYLHLAPSSSGGVTKAAAGGTAGGERGWERRHGGRLRARCPMWPQPGSHGARSSAGAGRAAEAARAPDEGAAGREGQAAGGGDLGHCTRSAHHRVFIYVLIYSF